MVRMVATLTCRGCLFAFHLFFINSPLITIYRVNLHSLAISMPLRPTCSESSYRGTKSKFLTVVRKYWLMLREDQVLYVHNLMGGSATSVVHWT